MADINTVAASVALGVLKREISKMRVQDLRETVERLSGSPGETVQESFTYGVGAMACTMMAKRCETADPSTPLLTALGAASFEDVFTQAFEQTLARMQTGA